MKASDLNPIENAVCMAWAATVKARGPARLQHDPKWIKRVNHAEEVLRNLHEEASAWAEEAKTQEAEGIAS